MPTKGFLTILISCFYLTALADIAFILSPFIFVSIAGSLADYVYSVRIVQAAVVLPALFLWFYCIYFYYKNDKYSNAGPKLFILNAFYTPFYFYKVIWKRKRRLINSYKSEPVLGNRIHIETEEEN